MENRVLFISFMFTSPGFIDGSKWRWTFSTISVDHESFCVVTNEGGAFISVVDLVVANTNVCSWVTHCGRGWDEYLKVLWMSLAVVVFIEFSYI